MKATSPKQTGSDDETASEAIGRIMLQLSALEETVRILNEVIEERKNLVRGLNELKGKREP